MFKELRSRLGENLRKLRAKRGWTQEEAAAACGMQHAHYQPLEAGKRNATLISLARLAKGFGIDASKLLAPER